VDEITAQEDCQALMQAAWCGVRLLATAHAADKKDLFRRSIYKPLAECGLFDTLIVLNRDKSWKVERMCQCQ
jgi:stage III sporulation protein AA